MKHMLFSGISRVIQQVWVGVAVGFFFFFFFSAWFFDIPNVFTATYTDDGDAGEFGSGTQTGVQWDAGNSWLEISTTTNAAWELPDSAASGWIDMTNNELLFHFEEGGYTNAIDEVIDSSGNGNHGQTGGTPTSVAGQLKQGIELDGVDDATDQYVYVPNDASLEITDAISISAWVYVDGFAAAPRTIIDKADTDYRPVDYQFKIHQTTGLLNFGTRDAAGTWQVDEDSADAVPTGEWVHVAVTYDRTEVVFYINGRDAGISDGNGANASALGSNNFPVHVGMTRNGFYHFDGKLDEVGIWSEALTQSEIETMYDRQSPVYGGVFTSRIIDAGAATDWDSFSWVPNRPSGKELPNSGVSETAYATGNADMTNILLLNHLNEAAGNPADDSGQGQTSSATDVTYGADGVFDDAFYFDGTGYISYGDDADFDFTGADSFSVSGWFRTADSDGYIMQKVVSAGSGWWFVRVDGSKLEFLVLDTGANSATITSAADVDDNKWHHFLAVRDQATGNIHLYIDGSIATAAVVDGTGDLSNDGPLEFGRRTLKFDDPYVGYMDEMAIWDRALSATEAADLYKRGALNMSFQVRSCNDNACAGEDFVGTSSSTATFFTELATSTTSTPSFSMNEIVDNNRYFQYRVFMDTATTTYSPELSSVSVASDSADPTVTISVDTSSIEEDGGVATITATLSAIHDQTVTTTLAFTGTATGNGTDYTTSSQTIVITAGNLSNTMTITGVNDASGESNETVIVDIDSVTNGIESGTQQETVYINDAEDDTDYTDDDNSATGFGSGTHDNSQWDVGNTWIEMDATGLSNGTSTFISRVMDAGASISWGTLSWVPEYPYGKELPDEGAVESDYSDGNMDMTDNVLLMHFNEDSYNGTAGEVTDDSGNNYDGTGSGDATTEASGVFDRAVTFDGTNDYISIADQDAFDGDASLSVSFWLKQTTIAANQSILWKGESFLDFSWGVRAGNAGSEDELWWFISDGDSGDLVETSGANMVADEWYHVVLVYDGTEGSDVTRAKIFVDGVNVTVDGIGTIPASMLANNDGILLGEALSDAGDHNDLNGGFDDLAIFNDVLTAEEVLDIYKRGALDLKFQVRSCDDLICSGETFYGPDGTANTYYTEITSSTTSTPSKTLTNVADNRYFQYQVDFETASSSFSPELNSVTVAEDSGEPTVTLSVDDNSIVEDGSVTSTITATLSEAYDQDVTVDLAFSGTATGGGVDYATSSNSIVITAGNTTGTITIAGVDDGADEGDETVIVDIDSVTNGTENGVQQVTITLTDDDAGAVTIDCSANPEIVEGVDFDAGDFLTLNSGGDTGGTCTLNIEQDTTAAEASITLGSLTLSEEVTLTHDVAGTTANTHNELHLVITGDLTVNANSEINVDAKGYLGGYQGANGVSTGRTNGNTTVGGSTADAGASHGGRAGEGGAGAAPDEYDSITNPVLPGGGGYGSNNLTQEGGNGGGVVIVSATNITVNGTISADGADRANVANIRTGGAGGTINLTASGDFSGTGSITAVGGGHNGEGSGGGGRIAIRYTTGGVSNLGTLLAAGGNYAGDNGIDGAAGTIFIYDTDTDANGHLTIDNNNNDRNTYTTTPIDADTDQTFDSVTIKNRGGLQVESTAVNYSSALLDVQASSIYDSDLTAEATFTTVSTSASADVDFAGDVTATTFVDSGATADFAGDLDATDLTVEGTFTVSASSTITGDLTVDAGSLTVSSTLTVPSSPAGAAGSLTTQNAFYVTAGTLTIPNGLTINATGGIKKDADTNLTALTIENGGTLSHEVSTAEAGTYNQLNLTINGDLTVDLGGAINVDAKGYLGGYQGDNNVTTGRTNGNTTVGGSTVDAGGSHGGRGGEGNGAGTAAEEYDSITNPLLPGGGGYGSNNNTQEGGNGGGVILVSATNITVNGTISADGADRANVANIRTGGAGGTINLTASGDFSGTGSITAVGGGHNAEGSGGGGRIAIRYTTGGVSNLNSLLAAGGNYAGANGLDGMAGTIFVLDTDTDANGHLTIDNNNNDRNTYTTTPIDADTDQTFDSVTVKNRGGINVESTAVNYSSALLDVQASSIYDSDLTAEATFTTVSTSASADVDFAGDVTATTFVDSGATVDFAADLDATDLTVDGTFTVSGSSTIAGDLVMDNGNLTVSSTLTLASTPSGATGTLTAQNAFYITAGTLTIPNGLTINAEGDLKTNATTNLTAVTVQNGGILSHTVSVAEEGTYKQVNFAVNGDLTVDLGGSINVDGKGYLGAGQGNNIDNIGRTNGNTTDGGSGNDAGGSHGGRGGEEVGDGSAAAAYDSIVNPVLPGGGGGGFSGGGNGGGVIIVSAVNIVVNGTISADGANGTRGSGAGGTVNLTATDTCSGTGTITAVGGGGANESAGGGGRIAIVCQTDSTNLATLSAAGGDRFAQDGAAGTIFKRDSDETYGELIIDNDGNTQATYTTSLLTTIPASDQLYNDGYFFATTTVQNYGILNIPAGVDSSSSTDNGVTEKFHCTSCTDDAHPETGTDDDDVSNGELVYDTATVAGGAGSNYIAFGGVSITVGAISGNTTEAGGTATFTVVLSNEPTSNVTTLVATSDATEGGVSTSSLTFTTDNWNEAKTVTVTGVDDNLVDGNIAYTITLAAATSDDNRYDGVDPLDVTVTNTDDDTATFTVSAISGDTTEAGGQATFTVVLDSQPTDVVTTTIATSDATEGTVSTSSLTFSAANWSNAQTVTVTGVDDDVQDGDIAYTITLAAAASNDGNYNGVDPDDVAVTNTDNDTDGVTITQSGGASAATEGGDADTFTVVLNTEPSDTVTTTITSDVEVTTTPAVLVFTTANWDTAQTVTTTAVDDEDIEGAHNGVVTLSYSSNDADYDGLENDTVTVSITDNDAAAEENSDNNNEESTPQGNGGFGFVDPVKPSVLSPFEETVGSGMEIAEGAEQTLQQLVSIRFRVKDVTHVALSNTETFEGARFQPFEETLTWRLSDGPGLKKVYARLRSADGGTLDLQDSIVLSEESCLLEIGSAYKHPNPARRDVWYVAPNYGNDGPPCYRRPFRNPDTFFTYFRSWSDVQVRPEIDQIPEDPLGFMPKGPFWDPQYGALVKHPFDARVYLLLGGRKYWITSEEVFERLYNGRWDWIEDVDPALLDEYPEGGEITDLLQHPPYTLVKYPGDPKVYLLEPNEDGKLMRRHIANEEVFLTLGYRFDRIVELSEEEAYPDGPPIE